MSVGAILTLGLGSFSDVNHVVTLGYVSSTTPTPTPATPTSSFVSGGGAQGWHSALMRRREQEQEELITVLPIVLHLINGDGIV